MTYEEFERGYLFELLRGGVKGLDKLRRQPTKDDLGSEGLLTVTDGLREFWDAHGEAINSQKPRLQNASNAFHAGHELWCARNGVRPFVSRDWGAELAEALNGTAQELGRCTVEATSRTDVVVEREVDVRRARG